MLRNPPIRNKNSLWQPYLLMDRGEMSNLYRGPPIDASYQVSVHLAKWWQKLTLPLQGEQKNPKQNKTLLCWRPHLSDLALSPVACMTLYYIRLNHKKHRFYCEIFFRTKYGMDMFVFRKKITSGKLIHIASLRHAILQFIAKYYSADIRAWSFKSTS
jgi:hypothetical protein